MSVCRLGVSNQALGGVVLTDVERLIGRPFVGMRMNQDVTGNWANVNGHSNEYDNGRVNNYRSIQIQTSGGWNEVTAGTDDATLTSMVNNILALPTKFNVNNPFIVCFNHETSIDSTQGGGSGISGTNQEFINAFRHVRDLFDSLNATVRSKTGTFLGGPIKMAYVGWDRMFVGANGIGPPTANQGIDDMDPDKGSSPAPGGTSYYEYIGSDVYNNLDTPGSFRYGTNAATLLDPIRAAAVARNKDFIIGEMGCPDGSTQADHNNKALWLNSLAARLKSYGSTGPGVCRYMFTTVKSSVENFNVDSSPEALGAWQALATDDYFCDGLNPPIPEHTYTATFAATQSAPQVAFTVVAPGGRRAASVARRALHTSADQATVTVTG